jgi:chromosome segregation ATPase
MRDHVIGTEAEVGRLSRDLALAFAELKRAHRRGERLSERRDELRVRVDQLRGRLDKSRQEVQRLRQRQAEAEGRPSFTSRVARRLRGGHR